MSAEFGNERMRNPIDLIERLAAAHDWTCDRTNDDELTLVIAGTWTDYHVSLNWRDDLEALHLACAFDFRVPENRLNEMYSWSRRSTSSSGSATSICGRRKASSCSATRCCSTARWRRRASAKPCCMPRSKAASATIRPSSSWSGRVSESREALGLDDVRDRGPGLIKGANNARHPRVAP